MLQRDKAYALAGRRHHEPEAELVQSLRKRRELRFNATPPGQATEAVRRLSALPGVVVEMGLRGDEIRVTYSLAEHAFESIEAILVELGFHLDGSLYARLRRALLRYCEETELRNMHSPERLIKHSNTVYAEAWQHHPHGDHDDTPPELREFR